MKKPKEIIVDHDIFSEQGVLLLSKGTKIILSKRKWSQLKQIGILNEVIYPIKEKHSNDIVPIDEEKVNLTIQNISNQIRGADFLVLQKSTDILRNIIFKNKNEDWHRFVSLICSYVDWLYTHSLNTAMISCVIAIELGYDDEQLFNITLGSLFHDIGLTLLPIKTLSKFSEFTEVETHILKNHCEMGYSMINEVNISNVTKKIILQHHERLDGSGYPNNLKVDEINPESLITMVAGEFDTATTAKLYQPAYTVQDTIEKMYLDNDLFPRQIVSTLTRILSLDIKMTCK